ncbi:hypothetical protein MUK51_02825 [Sphingobacterium faecium]|jgi:hypothetical protein|uniref:hypothetical protein n=1 Tax=Sphingobacterium faecium TaxID=34087 RepID=UPI0021B4E462|nr:hypothetical protein [Sphingobacterium faecium]UXD70226.1 hypothetical protein MUK51_02825 [Sphingobacterium faecium]
MKQEEKLYLETLAEKKVTLNSINGERFKFACHKAIIENPEANYGELKIACRIYLNLILTSPDIDLGGVIHPEE